VHGRAWHTRRGTFGDNGNVTTDRVFELPDGSAVVIDLTEASPAVADELETWSLIVAEDAQPEVARDPSAWSDLVSAGPLVVATVEGVIGNAAFAAFPAAARWLSGRRQRRRLDAAGAATRAIEAVTAVAGVPATEVHVTDTSSNAGGGWKVRAQLGDGRRANVLLAATGDCVSVRLF
jgi:hypothetical protein